MIILELNRPYCRLIRWLNKAVSNDPDRQMLTGILIKMPYIWACDGMRLHRARIEETSFQFTDGWYAIRGVVNSFVILDESKEYFDKYYDIQKIWDQHMKGFAIPEGVKSANYCLRFNPIYLSQALSLPSFSNSAKIIFTDQAAYTSVVFDLGKDGEALAEALILKIYSEDNGLLLR